MTTPPEYPYPGPQTGTVPDSSSTDETWVADVRRQVAAQMADPAGSRAMVAELDTGHGDLVNDAAGQAAIGAAADALHTQAHGD
jgi:hypothetical protein